MKGYESIIESEEQESGEKCFSFHVSKYSEYKTEMGALLVVVKEGDTEKVMWQNTGVITSSKSWFPVNINIDTASEFKVYLIF